MRIVGGEARGRSLKAPEGAETRPTSDRAREAVFNILAHAKWLPWPLEGAAVLDAFAGTGALGLEALSRGAAHAVFIENAKPALAACRTNIAALGFEGRAMVSQADALNPPPLPAGIAPRTHIFLDPPYGRGHGAKALAALARQGWLAPRAICMLEMEKKRQEGPPAGFVLRDERKYGIALVKFMEWEGG
jgi:16S rRNA (guanine966-N2)-methyltransferase